MMPDEAEVSTTAQSDSADDSHKYPPDKWILTKHVLIRQHNQFRTTLFTPNSDENDPSPIPIKYLDIMRHTDTSCKSLSEFQIDDFCKICPCPNDDFCKKGTIWRSKRA